MISILKIDQQNLDSKVGKLKVIAQGFELMATGLVYQVAVHSVTLNIEIFTDLAKLFSFSTC